MAINPELHLEDVYYDTLYSVNSADISYLLPTIRGDLWNSLYVFKIGEIYVYNLIILSFTLEVENSAPFYCNKKGIKKVFFDSAHPSYIHLNEIAVVETDMFKNKYAVSYDLDTKILTVWGVLGVTNLSQRGHINISQKECEYRNIKGYIKFWNGLGVDTVPEDILALVVKKREEINELPISYKYSIDFEYRPIVTNYDSLDNLENITDNIPYWDNFEIWESGSEKYVSDRTLGTKLTWKAGNVNDSELYQDKDGQPSILSKYAAALTCKVYSDTKPHIFFRGNDMYFNLEVKNTAKDGWEFFNTTLNEEFIKIAGNWISKTTGALYGKSRLGNSTSRPSEIPTGFEYYDTTLNKPIWWNGTEWIEAGVTDLATDSEDGLMSSEDKTKLDTIISTGDGTKYLSNDGTYKTIDLSSLTLKTINGQSLIGTGDITINSSSGSLSDDYTASVEDSPSPTAGDTYEQAISKLHKMINDLQTLVLTLQAQLADDNIWYGTESEYNSLQTKEQGTLYVIINS